MRRDAPDLVALTSPPPLPAGADDVVRALSPFVTQERMARIERVVLGRTRRLVVVLDQTTDPHNAAAVLRSADAFGIQEVHVIAGDQPFVAPGRVARGTAHWLDVWVHDSAEICASALHARGYTILAASMDGSIGPTQLPAMERVAVVFGNEHNGVSNVLRDLADGTYAIAMNGFVESLNVSVAAAITMHAATAGRAGDLSSEDQQTLRARFMLSGMQNGDEVVREMIAREGGGS